jgi:hypothetical protein
MKLLIYNNVPFHYEIIVNVIEKYDEILKLPKNDTTEIYLDCLNVNASFINYIKCKYPNIILSSIKDYDYFINCTIYMPEETINDGKHFYISHSVCKKEIQVPNIYYLMPKNNNNYLICNSLPFNDTKIKTDIPIYVIQGTISSKRRDFSLLETILKNTYNYDYKIKILGRGKLGEEFDKYKDKLILKCNLNFIDYHKEFADVYAIIPLVSKNKNSLYYKNKLTSSINYGLGYNLKFIIDNELNKIYNLNNSSFVYSHGDTKSLVNKFKKSLRIFYNDKNESIVNDSIEFIVNDNLEPEIREDILTEH